MFRVLNRVNINIEFLRRFQAPIHHLSEPIDVFSEWLDACEAAERGETASGVDEEDSRAGDNGNAMIQSTGYVDDSDEDDLGQPSGLGSGKNDLARPGNKDSGNQGNLKDDQKVTYSS